MYIYIYKKDKETEGPSGFSCCGQVMFPRCCDQLSPCPVTPCSSWGRDVPLPPCALLWERCWCHRRGLSSVSCTARDCDHELLGTPGREGGDRAGGRKSNPALEEPAYPFVVQAAAGGKEKPLVQLGMEKR